MIYTWQSRVMELLEYVHKSNIYVHIIDTYLHIYIYAYYRYISTNIFKYKYIIYTYIYIHIFVIYIYIYIYSYISTYIHAYIHIIDTCRYRNVNLLCWGDSAQRSFTNRLSWVKESHRSTVVARLVKDNIDHH